MIPDFSGDYFNYESSTDGELVEIISEGKTEFSEKLKKNMFNINIRRSDGKEMIWSPSNEAGRLLQEAFGKDTKTWIGQKIEVVHIDKKLKIRPVRTQKI